MDDVKIAILELLEKEGKIDYSPKSLSRRKEINCSIPEVSKALKELIRDGFVKYVVFSTGNYSYHLSEDFYTRIN